MIYTIPARYGFADALAKHLLESSDSLTLGQTEIYLPTRRAIRTVQRAFEDAAQGASHVLPRLRTLGDVDADELGLSGGGGLDVRAIGDAALDLPPAMGQAQRLFLLTQMVDRAWDGMLAMSKPKSTTQTLAHARTLLTLLDTIETEGLSLDDLNKAAPEGDAYADFWEAAAKFIRLLQGEVPKIESAFGRISAASRRRQLLALQAQRWQASPPSHPIILAGTTATIPAVADLAAVIANLPQGQVVLPGLDPHLEADAWARVAQTPSHPQHGMLALLDKLGVAPSDVQLWPGTRHSYDLDRHWALSAAQRPAGAEPVAATQQVDLSGLILTEAQSPEAEARAIALFLREALEDEGATAALITPDRDLAGRVAAELQRWDLVIDDSAGVPLTATLAGRLIQQSASLLGLGLDPLHLLTALGHPSCHLAGEFVQDLDLLLRKAPSHLDAETLGVLQPDWPDGGALLRFFQGGIRDAAALDVWVDRHLQLIDHLCPSLETWVGQAGETLAELFETLAAQSALLPDLMAHEYQALLMTLLSGETSRAAYGTHPRLAILGTLEARLLHVDAVALGGLNEGVWPKETDVGPWMNRPTRATIGLPSPERKVGLAAHDMAQAFGAKRVMISRATRVDGTPTLPSRWVERLKALAKGWGTLDALLAEGKPYLDWAAQLDHPPSLDLPNRPAIKASQATPPLDVRPTQVWTTDVELLVTNPYGFYAKRILNLRGLDPRGAEPANLMWGNFIHKVLETWVREDVRTFAALECLAEHHLADLNLSDGDRAVWQVHLRHTLKRFWAMNEPYLNDATDVEIKGSFQVGEVLLSGKADRLIRRQGVLHIIDYKTGSGASSPDQEKGKKPQLAILGLMGQAGGFPGAKPAEVHTAFFVLPRRIQDEGKATEEKPEILETVREGLEILFKAYQDPAQPYLSAPFGPPTYNNYAHLAREREA